MDAAARAAEGRMIMSGGKFNYADSRLKDEIFSWADELKRSFNKLCDRFGEDFHISAIETENGDRK